MDTFEIIALFLLAGIATAGVSLPLNRYYSKPMFGIGCILLVCTYTLLVSKQCYVTSDFKLGFTRAFGSVPFVVYLINALVISLYIVVALFCSYIYEKERSLNPNFQKDWVLNRWFGLVAGGAWAILLYAIKPDENCLIFFSTAASLALCIFAFIFAGLLPFGLLLARKK